MRVFIPPNFNDNGNILGGLVKKRNAVEAGIFLAFIILLYRLFFFGSILALSLFIIFAVLGASMLIIGFGDQSFCTVLLNKFRYKKNRASLTLMKPSDDEHF